MRRAASGLEWHTPKEIAELMRATQSEYDKRKLSAGEGAILEE